MTDLTKEQVANYAGYALNNRNRKDVYNACVILIRNWHLYSGDDERRHIFGKISNESVGNTKIPVNSPSQLNRAYQGWQSEKALGRSDAVVEAYEKELNRK